MSTDILLITPPFTQLNTPYPGTVYLKGFLNTKNFTSFQADLGLEVILKLFSKEGLNNLFSLAERNSLPKSENSQRILLLREEYTSSIDAVIAFLQGKNSTLAQAIVQDHFLPEASRFSNLEELDWAFGTMSIQDKAKHLATLYLEDLSDFIVENTDPNFGFSRYAERLGRSAHQFDELYQELHNKPSYIDELTLQELDAHIQKTNPKIIGFSVPFPGNLYSAFRCAKFTKEKYPHIHTTMGGGFPNTELRSLSDNRVFQFFDSITLDDGEAPIEQLIKFVNGGDPNALKRTWRLLNNEVVLINNKEVKDYTFKEVGTPDYSDLPLSNYISVIEVINPMHRLWSDGRWNKLTMAHGCYWGKCTFCDISLDYIKVYEPLAARLIVDRMEQLIQSTKTTGFHFVDEAAPPALMKEVALEILRRKLHVSWWTNIRFEKSFTLDLCRLLQASGCIAVSGGLEVASDRLLQVIKKGVTVTQVAQVCRNFTEAGIMIHAYLMYGFPTQTPQETIDSLEMVRQLFELGIVQSGFWHQFAMTAHSPIGLDPEQFKVVSQLQEQGRFANNDIPHLEKNGQDHSLFSEGLKASLYNYMHGIGFDMPLQSWFDTKVPKTTIPPHYIEDAISQESPISQASHLKVTWLGTMPSLKKELKSKKGVQYENTYLVIHTKREAVEIRTDEEVAQWFISFVTYLNQNNNTTSLQQMKSLFEEATGQRFEIFMQSKPANQLRDIALLLV